MNIKVHMKLPVLAFVTAAGVLHIPNLLARKMNSRILSLHLGVGGDEDG